MPKKTTKNSDQKDQSQWIFLTESAVLSAGENGDNHPAFCQLRHPKTDTGAMFLLSHGDCQVHEVIKFNQPYRSWFIDQSVQQDGAVHMTFPVDPMFLILPHLMNTEKSDKFQMLDQIVHDEKYPDCNRICSCIESSQLEQAADVKGKGDIQACRYNKEKTLTWLKLKVERTAEKLEERRTNVSGGSRSHVFIRSTKSAPSSREDYIRYAHGMVSDYLPQKLSKDLKEHMGIKDPEPPVHEKPHIDEPATKKAKTEKLEPTEDYSQYGVPKNEEKKTKSTAAQNKLNKVDKKGIKTISSFFSPKPKKRN